LKLSSLSKSIANSKPIVMCSINIRNILSEREYEIMELVSTGLYNKEIAVKLNCEETTIKKHLQNIFRKLRVNNRTEASMKFLKLNGMFIESENFNR
jgi:DNA-binding NarL/FixJ family response regulator